MKQGLIVLVLSIFIISGCTNPEEEAKSQYNNARLAALDGEKDGYEDALQKIAKKYSQTSTATEIISELEKLKIVKTMAEKHGYIRLTGLAGSFVENEKEGELFVINGVVTNEYVVPKSSIKVVGEIYDKAGNLLKEQAALCGNQIDKGTLENSPILELKNRMKKTMIADLKPGEKIPFTIVFNSLPRDLSEFVVRIEQ